MKKVCWFLIISLLCCLPAGAQTFKGHVVDEKGTSVAYASLYIRELSSGFVSDADGRFHTPVAAGSYTCEVSCIGYVSQTFHLQIPAAGLEKNIVLAERVYELGEVSVTRGGEDPAYAIMRQAIARAPYYRRQVKSYAAGIYLKGTGKVKEIPAILKLSKEVRRESKAMMGKLFVLEEQREVQFTAPNTWDTRVKASRNSFPDNIKVDMGVVSANLYAPTLFGKVSPLSVGAFTYYTFRLDGCYVENGHVVNKIKLIPRKDNPKLLSGYIYVIDDLWCLSTVDVSFRNSGIQVLAKAICKEVQPSVFLVSTTSQEHKIDVAGIRAEASFLASFHYTKVEVEKRLPGTFAVTAPVTTQSGMAPVTTTRPLTKKQEKLQQQIDKLTDKNDLTLGEAYQLSKLMARSYQAVDTSRSAHKFERTPIGNNSSTKTDSLASQRDSLYWASVRSIPLKPEELESYQRIASLRADSLKQPGVPAQGGGSVAAGSGKADVFSTLLFGHTFQSKNKKYWLQMYGLQSYLPQYNFVDGYWVGAAFSVGKRFSPASCLYLTPHVYYTTARKAVVGYGEVVLEYAPRRLGNLTLSGGSRSADYNGESGESMLINSLSTLLFARNDVKFYNKQYLSVHNQVEVANSLLLTAGLTWQRRQSLDNNRSKSWFGKEGTPNTPANSTFTPMPTNHLLKASLGVEYTPAHYYRMVRGKKVYDDSRWPTFALQYERAFPQGSNSESPSFHRIEFSARQKIEFGMFNTLHWSANGGTFCDAVNMQFPDYKHFAATRFPLTDRMFTDGFVLLDNYAYSTSTRWAQAGVAWSTPYLLLKHLPFLKKKSWDEALHIRSLAVFRNQPYTEVGYSIGFTGRMRAGVFASFSGVKYQSVGVSVTLSLPW